MHPAHILVKVKLSVILRCTGWAKKFACVFTEKLRGYFLHLRIFEDGCDLGKDYSKWMKAGFAILYTHQSLVER
jgi:hypothetical protein